MYVYTVCDGFLWTFDHNAYQIINIRLIYLCKSLCISLYMIYIHTYITTTSVFFFSGAVLTLGTHGLPFPSSIKLLFKSSGIQRSEA